MRKWTAVIILALGLSLAFGQPTGSQRVWHRIGIHEVGSLLKSHDFSVDRKARFRAVRLQVSQAALLVEEWVFEYRDGTTQQAGFFGVAPADKPYPPIQVRDGLKRVRFRYRSLEPRRKARVELQGIR